MGDSCIQGVILRQHVLFQAGRFLTGVTLPPDCRIIRSSDRVSYRPRPVPPPTKAHSTLDCHVRLHKSFVITVSVLCARTLEIPLADRHLSVLEGRQASTSETWRRGCWETYKFILTMN